MSEIAIRRARADETDAIAELYLRSRRAAEIPAMVHSDAEVRSWVRAALMIEREVWVVAEGDRLVAMMALSDASVEQLYVDPEHQRRGHGARLVELAQAQRDALTLWTFAGNLGAQRFYEAHGFVRSGPDSDANEEQSPAIPYRWQRLAG